MCELSREEIEVAEAREDKYWKERMEAGEYPCDKCNQWTDKNLCPDCEEEN